MSTLQLEAGQRSAGAHVDAVAVQEVVRRVAVEPELVRVHSDGGHG